MDLAALLERLLEGIGAIGCGPNGWTRIGFSEDDQRARRWFAGQMEKAGLNVRTDAFGNLFGRLEGLNPALPVVATGSHLDTVPCGGNYDGVLGCASGLVALADIAAGPRPSHSLELIIFQSEESSRFACSTLGSKILTGCENLESLRNLTDREGITLPAAMAGSGLGFDDSELKKCRLDPAAYKAFIELHMDQGPALEDMDLPLGIVTGIVGVRRAVIRFKGIALHAGATPMSLRHDALLSASAAVLALDEICRGYKGEAATVGTTGSMTVEPGAINIIPSEVIMHCEMRSGSGQILKTAWQTYEEELEKIAARNGTPLTITVTESSAPVIMSEDICALIARECDKNDIRYTEMYSGAGHDCMNMARIIPSAMIFVRGKDGISHNKAEFVRQKDAAAGCRILRDTLWTLAQ